MKLIVGLGNPGAAYSMTRHNIGFMIIDQIAKKRRVSFKQSDGFHIARQKDFILLKPMAFMNVSGKAIRQIMSQNSINEILVIVDDIYLDFSQIRIRKSGGDGGHNGIKSVINEINTNEFFRFRVGIGNESQEELSDFVLSEFTSIEKKILAESIEFSSYLITNFIDTDYHELLNSFSKLKSSYSKKITKILESISPKEDNNE